MKLIYYVVCLINISLPCVALFENRNSSKTFLTPKTEKKWYEHVKQTIKEGESLSKNNSALKMYKSLYQTIKDIKENSSSSILSLTRYQTIMRLAQCIFSDIEKYEEYKESYKNARRINSSNAWQTYKRVAAHLIVERLQKNTIKFTRPTGKTPQTFWKEFLENNAHVQPKDTQYIKVAFLLLYKIDDIIENVPKKG